MIEIPEHELFLAQPLAIDGCVDLVDQELVFSTLKFFPRHPAELLVASGSTLLHVTIPAVTQPSVCQVLHEFSDEIQRISIDESEQDLGRYHIVIACIDGGISSFEVSLGASSLVIPEIASSSSLALLAELGVQAINTPVHCSKVIGFKHHQSSQAISLCQRLILGASHALAMIENDGTVVCTRAIETPDAMFPCSSDEFATVSHGTVSVWQLQPNNIELRSRLVCSSMDRVINCRLLHFQALHLLFVIDSHRVLCTCLPQICEDDTTSKLICVFTSSEALLFGDLCGPLGIPPNQLRIIDESGRISSLPIVNILDEHFITPPSLSTHSSSISHNEQAASCESVDENLESPRQQLPTPMPRPQLSTVLPKSSLLLSQMQTALAPLISDDWWQQQLQKF